MMNLSEYVENLRGKKIGVLGLGENNRPLIDFLGSCGCDVTACGRPTRDQIPRYAAHLEALGVKLKLGPDFLENLEFDILFRAPSLMLYDSRLQKARERGSIVTSEMEAFLSLCPCKVIGVTGSDGKTTTSNMIARLLQASGYQVHLGGNNGHPLFCDLPKMSPDDIAVVEMSSFHLHSIYCCPDIAVITNITPNHLDVHKDYQDYIDSKRFVFLHQTGDCRLILNQEDEQTPSFAQAARARIAYFSAKAKPENGAFLQDGILYRVSGGVERAVVHASEVRIPGEHNIMNFLAAFSATEGLVSDEICARIAQTFPGVEHRLETVRILQGVTYINDSIATSPSRTIAGLKAMKTRPIVIAGGHDKHVPYDELGTALCQYAKAVVLVGDTATKIRNAIEDSPCYDADRLPIVMADDFRKAVITAKAFAEAGDIVLLSPASSSHGLFQNYIVRGRAFKSIIMNL